MAVPVTIPFIKAPIIPITHIEIDVSMSMLISTMFGKKSGKAKALKRKAHAIACHAAGAAVVATISWEGKMSSTNICPACRQGDTPS